MPLQLCKSILLLSILHITLFGTQKVLAASAPKVGRAAAAKYFQKNADDVSSKGSRYMASDSGISSEERCMTVGLSLFTKSETFNWGKINKEEDAGKYGFDMLYRLDQTNYVDYSLKVAYTEYVVQSQRASKMSFMYAATLPDAGSKFPLYFGASAGPGVFFTQLKDESSLTLDYQLYLGLRIFNLFGSTGFYVEGGMKNHLQLTSDGQLNGTYISAGAVFTF
jgi:hypothetical protein